MVYVNTSILGSSHPKLYVEGQRPLSGLAIEFVHPETGEVTKVATRGEVWSGDLNWTAPSVGILAKVVPL